MPRLPTIRVIGSHDFSTTLPRSGRTRSLSVTAIWSPPFVLRPVAGRQLRSVVTPLRLLVDAAIRDRAHLSDERAVRALDDPARERGTRRLVHERHELVGEAGHRAADADPAHVRAASEAVHPAALRHVAVHDRPPAAGLHEALRAVVIVREVGLLV